MLSLDELLKGYKTVFKDEMMEKELTELFHSIDKENSGHIDYQQFIDSVIGSKFSLSRKKFKKVFKVLDSERRGIVAVKDIQNGLLNMGEASPEML